MPSFTFFFFSLFFHYAAIFRLFGLERLVEWYNKTPPAKRLENELWRSFCCCCYCCLLNGRFGALKTWLLCINIPQIFRDVFFHLFSSHLWNVSFRWNLTSLSGLLLIHFMFGTALVMAANNGEAPECEFRYTETSTVVVSC